MGPPAQVLGMFFDFSFPSVVSAVGLFGFF
jgi:hypothetical protein